ncbi:MAG: DUF502 domain-containing protein [Chlamydiales bacterium]
MKKYLLAGLITLLPIALTFMIITWLFHFFTGPFLGIVQNFVITYEGSAGLDVEKHRELTLFISRLLALIFVFVLTLLLGVLGRRLFFKTIMQKANSIFLRIPFLKSVYRISKEVTGAVFSQGGKTFQKTILIPFPHSEAHTIAFLTGDAPPVCKQIIKELDVSIFVPTSPHPLTGYMLFASKKNLMEVDISVEEAFKFLLSCGTTHPGESEVKKT